MGNGGSEVKKIQKKKLSLKMKKNLKGYLFVMPFIFGLALFFLPALKEAIRFSFADIVIADNTYRLVPVGFERFKQLLTVDPTFVRNIVESISSLIINTAIIILYALIIATVLNKNLRGKSFFRVILFLPVIIATGIVNMVDMSNVITAAAGTAAETGSSSVAGGIFSSFDIENLIMSLQLGDGFVGIIVGAINNIYKIITESGVQMIIFLAGLQSISPSLYEAAKVEGATWWGIFWKISMPMLSPIIMVNLVYTVVDSFTNYGNPIMDRIYKAIITDIDFSLASAMALFYFVVVGAVLVVIMIFAKKLIVYEN